MGKLGSLAVMGNITSQNGNLKASILNGVLGTAAQPNVTSLGTLTSLNLSGGIKSKGLEDGMPSFGSVGIEGNLTVTGYVIIKGGSVILEEIPAPHLADAPADGGYDPAPRANRIFRLQGVAPHFNQPIVIE